MFTIIRQRTSRFSTVCSRRKKYHPIIRSKYNLNHCELTKHATTIEPEGFLTYIKR